MVFSSRNALSQRPIFFNIVLLNLFILLSHIHSGLAIKLSRFSSEPADLSYAITTHHNYECCRLSSSLFLKIHSKYSAYFRSLSKSRISVRSTSSFEIFGSSAGFSSASLFNELMPFIATNIAKAIIAKSIIDWMNFP